MSLDFAVGLTPTANATMVLTIDLGSLVAAAGSASASVLSPSGGTFAAATAARGWGSITSVDANPAASVAQVSAVAAVAANDRITVTVTNSVAFDVGPSVLVGKVWYDLTA